MTPDVEARKAEVLRLQGALQGNWTALSIHLNARKQELIIRLVSGNDEQTRGRIKEIDDLLALPEWLQQEAIALAAPQQVAEFP